MADWLIDDSTPKLTRSHSRALTLALYCHRCQANYREALREARADEAEGADIMMVKPGLPYLDIIRLLRDNTPLPIAAYHVSGEYAMLKAAAERGWLDEEECVMEALLSLRRAGSDLILSYYATEAAKWMAGEK